MLKRLAGVLILLSAEVASASTVKLRYSGTVETSSVGGISVGSTFDGEITYDSGRPAYASSPAGSAQFSGVQSWVANFAGQAAYVPGSEGISMTSSGPGVYGYDSFQIGGTTLFGDRQIGILPKNSRIDLFLTNPSAGPLAMPLVLPTNIVTNDFRQRSIVVFDYGSGRYTLVGRVDSISTALVGPASPVPEPAGWAMMICGFGFLGALARRRPKLAWSVN